MANPNKTRAMTFRNDLTAETVRAVLEYHPDEGLFYWRWNPQKTLQTNTRDAGKVAGYRGTGNKRRIEIAGVAYLASRLAWLYMTGQWPKEYVDHRDNDPTNDRWKNLREASPSQTVKTAK